MRHTPAPFYLKAQLRSAAEEIQELANQKGLVQAFEMDLFALQRSAEEALAADTKEDIDRVLDQAKSLESRLRAAPGKSDPMLLR